MGDISIEVWLADLTFPGYMDRLHALGRAFNDAHPGYRVRIEGRDFRGLPQELAAAAAQGRPPAIAEYYFYGTQAARDARLPSGEAAYTSVEKAIAGRSEVLGEPVVLDDLEPAVREFYTFRGDLTSMPSVATTIVIYGNERMLSAAGVSRLPTTWSEVEAACEAVAGTFGPGRGITWANHGLIFQQALAVQGGWLADHENGRTGVARTVDLASEEMLAWATWWKSLHRDGHYKYTGKIPDWEGSLGSFASEGVALRISSTNDMNYMAAAARNTGFGLTAGRFPARDGLPYAGNAIAGTSLWLSSGLDERTRDGALAFLQFMHNPENAARRHQENSFVPITGAATRRLRREGWFDAHPHHELGTTQFASYPGRLLAGHPPVRGALFGGFAGVQDVMTRAMHDVLVSDADVRTRFEEATVEAQRLLDAYHEDAASPTGPSRPESLRIEFFTDAEAYSGASLENAVRLGADPTPDLVR